MRCFYLIGLTLCLALGALPLWGGEYVVLGNGFRLRAERHETAGNIVRVFSAGGVAEIPASLIAGYEAGYEVGDESPKGDPANPVPQVAAAAVPEPDIEPSPARLPLTPHDLASSAAKKYSLPEAFVRSVMAVESAFNPGAVSPKGATGLMQLMPETARRLGVDARDPQQNAEGGARYLRELLARYESQPDQVLLALAAYNAGPAAVERYHGVPPYRETREYILRVLKIWNQPVAK